MKNQGLLYSTVVKVPTLYTLGTSREEHQYEKTLGINDALIQPYSGHASRQLLEVYSKLAITEAQEEYN